MQELFLSLVDTIRRAARHACQRRHLKPEEIEDFESEVMVKIIANDYAVLRKYSGRCSLVTYILVVVQSQLKDHLNHLWGKWRPSAEAVRLGRLAEVLDRLLTRDRYT
ncbi:MAG: hypothetical protein M3O15_11885, partial [Acidobacteriota bacterium]|nr:hypothetical protein [Acidobacteriota bacterium]